MTNIERVRKALHDYRNLTSSFRYGGMARHYADAQLAVEAFERILKPELPGMEGDGILEHTMGI
jgi:hypothetical protein